MVIALCLFLQGLMPLTWMNTGELQNAISVRALTTGLNGYLFSGTIIDSVSQDRGRVFFSTDGWNWERCAAVPWQSPDTIDGVYALFSGAGDTLFAGTGLYDNSDLPRVHKSSDGGASWTPLNSYGTYRVGSRVYALFEDNTGLLHLGNNYWGMSSAIPRYSTDRGNTWQQGGGTINYNSQHYCFCQCSDNTIFFGSWGTNGGVHFSTDNGSTWSPASPLTGVSDSYIIIEAGTDTIFVGCDADHGRIYRTVDQGTNWTDLSGGYFDSTTAVRSLVDVDYNHNIYAGTSPNAEVFVSVDRGATWETTGILSEATTIYKLIEVTKSTASVDSHFIYAATGPNGDVFRALLGTVVNTDEYNGPKILREAPKIERNPFISYAVFYGYERDRFIVYDIAGLCLGEYFGDRVGTDLKPGIYFAVSKNTSGSPIKLIKLR